MLTILPALLAASQLAALPAPASSVCSAVDVVAPQQKKATKKKKFSAKRTLDLELRTRLKGVRRLSGEHLLHLKLYTPRGYLYQTITVPFYREPRKGRKRDREAFEYQPSRVVPGFPRALDVQKTTRVRKGRRQFDQVTARLPVAGTSITLGSLFGRWTVVPFLDDETAPCGRSRQFRIRE
jgi:hypothetical protein